MGSVRHAILALTVLALVSPVSLYAQATRPFDPTDHYATRQIQGWTVLINTRVLQKPDLAQAATLELDHQLYQAQRRLPPASVAKLKSVKIWLELDDAGVPGGVYHPNIDWLRAHNFNPAKARCVEFGNARNLLDWSIEQPFMALHELSHAYHDQVLGYSYAPIAAAYRAALASKRYEKILHVNGQTVRHYALNNDQEFFAEMSEAFFGTNDMYPFVRGELKTYDPATFRTVAEAWGLKADGAPAPTIASPAAPPTTPPAAPPATPPPAPAGAAAPAVKDDQNSPGLYRVSAGPGGRYTITVRAKSRENAIDIGLKTVAQRAMAFDENVEIKELKVERIGP